MLNRKSILVWAFAVLGFYYANDAFATCVRVLGADGRLLGCALVEPYPPDIKTCSCSTATTSVQTNLSHHEVLFRIGSDNVLDGFARNLSAGNWEITPGVFGESLATAVFSMDDVECSGWDVGPDLAGGGACPTGGPNKKDELDCEASWLSLGAGRCDYRLQFESPVATCFEDDNDRGGGNSCLGFDPDNPPGSGPGPGKGGGKKATFITNQSCSAAPDSTEAEPKSIMAYNFLCQEGIRDQWRGTGFVQWRKGQGTPAQFTNCTTNLIDGTVDPDDPPIETDTPNDVCMMQFGGWPTFIDPDTGERRVDVSVCETLFPETAGFAVGQVLSLKQEWLGTCESPTQPPSDVQSIAFEECGEGPDKDPCTSGTGSGDGSIPSGTTITFNEYPQVVQVASRGCVSDLGGGVPGTGPDNTIPPTVPFVWPSLGGPLDFDLQHGQGNFGDGFDNQGQVDTALGINWDRVCPPHITVGGDILPTTLSALTQSGTRVPTPMEEPNGPVNQKCEGGTDSGVVKTKICGTADLDVEQDIKGLTDGQLDPATGPVMEGGQRPHAVEFGSADSGPCFDAEAEVQTTDATLTWYSCTTALNGVAQMTALAAQRGDCTNDPVQDKDTCPVAVFLERTTPNAQGTPVILFDVLDIEVNNVKAIPGL